LKFKGEYSLAIVGDNTTIRECVTINRGTAEKGKTQVGNNCLLMAYVHIAHDCIVGNNCIIANSVQMAGHVEVGDFAVIGGASAILQFVKIGAHTMTAGCSQVRKDIPPYVRAAREPISFAGLNLVGLRRRGFTAQQIGELQEIYRKIFNSGMNVSTALKYIQENMPDSAFAKEIVDFIAQSSKGIIKSGSELKEE
ncbi:MAG: acyl-ACP--UDP-N-acetylglucosamine O-acyltransferase, partial [Flammeovirgaceae bacterium]|nr:acyl-ACP--UDP-N-acetylglucosamine O-acyltransferase [Flammeovirgaceae bacterium]MDW8288648.1 acyl-ACP--UDP-N-acetylglucosamine O-acyltransferase [Flammeovirgaceae bacterium]